MATPTSMGLHDIVLPEPVSWMPATIGWVGVALVLMAVAAWGAWRALQRWRADAYRREALEELAVLRVRYEEPAERPAALAALAPLLKRTALSMAPRERVASLSGEEWRRFLDEQGPEPLFVAGPGRRLEEAAYGAHASVAARDEDGRALFGAVESWVRGHRRVEEDPASSRTTER